MNNQVLRPLVLIADDDPDDRLLITEAFAERYRECRLEFAKDGVELIQLLASREPDLILLDLNMPLMDGRQALEKIKGNPGLRRIPTVILTTSDDDEDIDFCYRAGANSYIVKPSSYSNLLTIVSVLRSYWIDTATLPTRQERHD